MTSTFRVDAAPGLKQHQHLRMVGLATSERVRMLEVHSRSNGCLWQTERQAVIEELHLELARNPAPHHREELTVSDATTLDTKLHDRFSHKDSVLEKGRLS